MYTVWISVQYRGATHGRGSSLDFFQNEFFILSDANDWRKEMYLICIERYDSTIWDVFVSKICALRDEVETHTKYSPPIDQLFAPSPPSPSCSILLHLAPPHLTHPTTSHHVILLHHPHAAPTSRRPPLQSLPKATSTSHNFHARTARPPS